MAASAFCVISDVEALNQNRGPYSSATKPTDTQVTTFMYQRAALIRGIMRKHDIAESGLDADALEFLERLNAVGAAADAEKAAIMGTAPFLSEHGKELFTEWETLYKLINDDPAVLSTSDIPSAQVRSRPQAITPSDAGTDPNNEKWNPRMRMGDDW